jgi:hypothetical protein
VSAPIDAPCDWKNDDTRQTLAAEAFCHRDSGTVFPIAPGVLGGSYDPAVHVFQNFSVSETVKAFRDFMAMAREENPGLRFLITVSPVPLAATASGDHVEVATVRSKSILRAACDEIVQADEGVDYFPSYEIITSPSTGGRFYHENLRDVTEEGVATVMATSSATNSASVAVMRSPTATVSGRPSASQAHVQMISGS